MSEGATSQSQAGRPKSKKDRWVKLAFLAVVVIVAIVLYMRQVQGPSLGSEWGNDLGAALETAKGTGQRVIAFFHSPRGSHEDNSFVIGSLTHFAAEQTLSKANVLRVQVTVDDVKAPAVQRYGIKELPAVAVLSAEGKLLDVRTGRVGHAAISAMLNDTAPRSTAPTTRP